MTHDSRLTASRDAARAASDWALPLLCCPHCRSALAAETGLLRCRACRRTYPIVRYGEDIAVPRLKRGDAVATLAHDVIAAAYDHDTIHPRRRAVVAHYERRERFLARLANIAPRDRAVSAATSTAARSPLFARFVELLGPGGTVLDVACGDGAWSAALLCKHLRVIAVDADGPTAVRAAGRLRPAGRPAANAMPTAAATEDISMRVIPTEAMFVEADMMELPLAEASLDGVWCGRGFSHVRPDRRAVFFRLAHRALRPRGLLYIDARSRPLAEMARRYAYERLIARVPVRFGEYVDRAPGARGAAWRYRAMTPALALRALCREHGFQVLALRRAGPRWLLLARKKG